MKLQEFVDQVQDRAYFESPEDAMKAIEATLTTLGERLSPGEAHSLAEQLPPELGQYLEQSPGPQSFDLDDFLTRVSVREGTDITEAAIHARVVLDVLRDSVSPAIMGRLRHQLTRQFDSLFTGPGRGHVPGGHR